MKYRIEEIQACAGAPSSFILYERVGRIPFRKWEHRGAYDSLKQAEARINALVGYPRRLARNEYDRRGNQDNCW